MMSNTSSEDAPRRGWTFLSNHGHVLVCIARNAEMRLREVASEVGITERAAHAIVSDLVSEGYVIRTRVGNHNRYEVRPDQPLRHPLEHDRLVGQLLAAVAPER